MPLVCWVFVFGVGVCRKSLCIQPASLEWFFLVREAAAGGWGVGGVSESVEENTRLSRLLS